MPIIDGCALVEVAEYADQRGSLSILEIEQQAGFLAKRVFIIAVPEPTVGLTRANHATSGKQAILVLSGSCVLELDNGSQQQSLVCVPGGPAIIVGPGVWRRIGQFKPGTMILVIAEEAYSETDYFTNAAPELVARLSHT